MQTILGIVLGSIMTYLSLEYAYTPPEIFQLPSKIQAVTENVIASTFIEDTEATIKQRQRSVAVLIKNDSDYFIEIDNAIDNRFTNEAIEKIARGRLSIIKNYDHAFKIAFNGEKNQAIREHLKRKYGTNDLELIKERMIIEEIHKDLLVYKMLQKHFPGYSDEEIVHAILEG
jgi:hypothetical protein